MFKSVFSKGFFLCLIPCVLLCPFFTSCSSLLAGKTTQTTQSLPNSETTMINEVPFACNMSALDKDQSARYKIITAQLVAAKQEVQELPDGYGFRFPSTAENIKDTAEFVTYERACCPFFDFEINVEKNNGTLWLKIKGREGVKDFIRDEFGI